MMFKYLLIPSLVLLVGCSDTATKDVEAVETGKIVRQLSYNDCRDVPEVYYPTQDDTWSYFRDTRDMTTFWDSRYGDNTVGNCYASVSTTGTPIEFGGPQATLINRLGDVYPWAEGNNLMVQVDTDDPTYDGEVHGGISINFFITNKRTKERLNYVISLFTYGVAWQEEQQDILYDPTTDTRFISTIVDDGTQYVTMSPISTRTNTEGFFRVNITSDTLPVDNPSEWYLNFIGIQYEVEESISNGTVATEFRDFSVYIADGVL